MKQPLENVIKSIDESEVAFEIQFSINYRPANDKEQFLKVTGHYNVGKHKVTEVAKETGGHDDTRRTLIIETMTPCYGRQEA